MGYGVGVGKCVGGSSLNGEVCWGKVWKSVENLQIVVGTATRVLRNRAYQT